MMSHRLVNGVAASMCFLAACAGGSDGETRRASGSPKDESAVAESDAARGLFDGVAVSPGADPGAGDASSGDSVGIAGEAGESSVGGATCTGDGYRLTVPDGWFHFECRVFNTVPITSNPDACDCQFPVDVVAVQAEGYDAALERIEGSSTWTIENQVAAVIANRQATRLDTMVEENGQRFVRRIYVVDATPGTVFLAATDGPGEAPSDLDYELTLATATAMVDSLTIS